MTVNPQALIGLVRHAPAAMILALLACGGAQLAEPAGAKAASREVPEPVAQEEPPRPESGDWQIVDLMPTWWRYWGHAEPLDRSEQVRAFEEMLVGPHPELFAKTVIGKDPTAPFEREARIGAFLDDVDTLLPAMRLLSASIERDLPAHRATFVEAFPEFHWDGTVYFTISLDAFDGAVRVIDDKPQLLFGVDKIARLHGSNADLAPLFHHELFHIHHLVNGEPFDPEAKNRMYQALWAEGLAVYVAHELNPSASWQALVPWLPDLLQ